MTTITLGGNPTEILGDIPQANEVAADFTYVKDDMSDAKLSDSNGKIRIILSVPSLETGVCQAETRAFNEKVSNLEGVECLVVSRDIPLAMKRFCETEGLANVINASDFRYRELGSKYNVEITEGKFKGLLARALWVVDREGTIVYAELVPEVGQEPDYDKAMEAVNAI